jgi:hypothetical protein
MNRVLEKCKNKINGNILTEKSRKSRDDTREKRTDRSEQMGNNYDKVSRMFFNVPF